MKRDQPMINQFILPALDHDTAAHIQHQPVPPDVIHAPHNTSGHLPVLQREKIRKGRRGQVNAKRRFPVSWGAVFVIIDEISAVENATVLLLGVCVPGQDLVQYAVDLDAVLLQGDDEAAAL